MVFIRDRQTGDIVDPERNAVLYQVAGSRSGYKDWEINWNGDVIGFSAKDTSSYGGETRNILEGMEWYVHSLKIPESHKDRRSEVMGIIKEALEAYVLVYAPRKIDSHVKFNPGLIR